MAADQVESWGVPWEQEFGYVQAVRHGRTIRLAGQFSHDGEGLVAPAPVDADGRVTDFATMAEQMRRTYANAAELLGRFGATMADVVAEVVYVLDMDSAFAVAGAVRRAAFGTDTPVVSTILVTPRLAQPGQLVEISFTAEVQLCTARSQVDISSQVAIPPLTTYLPRSPASYQPPLTSSS